MAGVAKKAAAVALICGGVAIATPKPAEAVTIDLPPSPTPVLTDAWPQKVEIGALKAGANETLLVEVTFPKAVLTYKAGEITLKRGTRSQAAAPRSRS